jgi:lipid-binding SYLF domain-containing protein
MAVRSATRSALAALAAVIATSTASFADSGSVTLTIYKAGWIIGGSGGSGSKTVLRGRVRNITQPSDIAGVYGAAGAGIAIGKGARAIVLTNQKGAVLELSGREEGLMANVDLSGLAITLK